MRRPFIILAVMLFAALFAGIAIDYTERHSLPPPAKVISASRRTRRPAS
jgi:hypothetical protein